MGAAVSCFNKKFREPRRVLLVSEVGGFRGEQEQQLLALAGNLAAMGYEVNGLFARQGTNFRTFEPKFKRVSFSRRDWRPLAAESDFAWVHTISDDRLLTDLQRWMPTVLSVLDFRFVCPTGLRRLPLWNLKCPFRCGPRFCTLCADLRKTENFQYAPFARLSAAAHRCDRLAVLNPELSGMLLRNRYLAGRMVPMVLGDEPAFREQFAQLTDGLHLD